MKTVNDLPVYEGEDTCALDEYSKKLAEAIPEIIKKNKYNDEQITKQQIDQNNRLKKLEENQIHIQTEQAKLINIKDSSELSAQLYISGNVEQDKEPTPENPVEIKCLKDNIQISKINQNLLKLVPPQTKNFAGLEVTVDEEGIITINGTASDFFPTFLITGDTIETSNGTPSTGGEAEWYKTLNIPNSDYTFKFEYISGTGGNEFRPFIFIHSLDGQNYCPTQGNTTKVATYTGNIGGVSFYVDEGQTFENYKFRIMLVKGTYSISNFPDFILNKQEDYTLKIQKEMLTGDYFIKEIDGWKEVHNWKKYIESNTSNIYVEKKDNDGTFNFEINVENGYNLSDIICNMFKKWNNDWTKTGCFIAYNSIFYAIVKFGEYGFTEDLTTDQALQKFGELLQQNNLIFYYTVKEDIEPTKLPCTEEQITVLEQLNNLDLFKGENNIITKENIALLQLNYIADTKTYINNKINDLTAQVNTINELLSTSKTSAILLENMQTDLESEVV